MTAGEQIAGTAVGGRPSSTRRPVDYEPAPHICPACLTDQQTDECPTDCLARKERQR